MDQEFDKSIMFNNINFLIKEKGKKIGEVEKEAGVSPGYISRASKDENSMPGLEFVIKVAHILQFSIDTLISVRLDKFTPTERYIISFLDKMISDTKQDKIDWNKEDMWHLREGLEHDVNGKCKHPLIKYVNIFEPRSAVEVEGDIFESKTFGLDTVISGDCFNMSMNERMILYIMNIACAPTDEAAIEITIKAPGIEPTYIASTEDIGEIGNRVNELYKIISESMKHIKINENIKNAINDYMDDVVEEDNPPLPFD